MTSQRKLDLEIQCSSENWNRRGHYPSGTIRKQKKNNNNKEKKAVDYDDDDDDDDDDCWMVQSEGDPLWRRGVALWRRKNRYDGRDAAAVGRRASADRWRRLRTCVRPSALRNGLGGAPTPCLGRRFVIGRRRWTADVAIPRLSSNRPITEPVCSFGIVAITVPF